MINIRYTFLYKHFIIKFKGDFTDTGKLHNEFDVLKTKELPTHSMC